MIFVDRPFQPPPDLERFNARLLHKLSVVYESGSASLAQRRPDFEMPAGVLKTVRQALQQVFRGRCAYCERHAAYIDHFRPRWRATRIDRRIDPEHYWWLAAE